MTLVFSPGKRAWPDVWVPDRAGGDEPANLRQDIIDELNDHLDCAARQEMLRGKDENESLHSALERFGDLHTIARQLWWDAMKEQVRKVESSSSLAPLRSSY